MSKVISKEDSQECESWVLPSLSSSGQESAVNMLTASQIEKLQKQAYDEAYAEGKLNGYNEGLAAVQQDIQARIETFNGLLNSLDRPFHDLDRQVDDELVVLVQSLVKQMVRREIKTDPGQIIAVIREAIESLPVASRQIQLRLHPEDAALVNDFYKMGEQEQAWNIVEDPLISRGGCKVITSVTQVDATLETRLTQLFAQVFGERQRDGSDTDGKP